MIKKILESAYLILYVMGGLIMIADTIFLLNYLCDPAGFWAANILHKLAFIAGAAIVYVLGAFVIAAGELLKDNVSI